MSLKRNLIGHVARRAPAVRDSSLRTTDQQAARASADLSMSL